MMENYELNLFGFARGLTEKFENVYGILVHGYQGGKMRLFISPVHMREQDTVPSLIPVIKGSLRIGEDKNGETVYSDDFLSYTRPNGRKFMLVAHYGDWKWKETELKREGGWYNKKLCLWLDECQLEKNK